MDHGHIQDTDTEWYGHGNMMILKGKKGHRYGADLDSSRIYKYNKI